VGNTSKSGVQVVIKDFADTMKKRAILQLVRERASFGKDKKAQSTNGLWARYHL
jgi:hypothetical protein